MSPRKAKFVISMGEDGQYYFVLKARNGKVIAQSEGYVRKASALNGIASIMENAENADIVDTTITDE